jgi:hypothetical protein
VTELFGKEKNLSPSPGIEHMLPIVHLVAQPLFWIILPPQLAHFGTEFPSSVEVSFLTAELHSWSNKQQ